MRTGILFFIILISLMSSGCVNWGAVKVAKYICACEFSCTNGVENIPYFQNVPLDNREEGTEKCFNYSKNSCSAQGLDLASYYCKKVMSKEELDKELEEQRRFRS